jgi:hypothetical protein
MRREAFSDITQLSGQYLPGPRPRFGTAETMMSPNEFWLQLHRLAEAYQAEGENAETRLQAIVQEFRELAGPARREVLSDLQFITHQLPRLHVRLESATRELPAALPPPKEEPRRQAR